MAEIEEVGVEAVVKGFPEFLAKLTAMNKAIASTGVASAASATGIGIVTIALGALIAIVAVVIVGIGAIVAAFGLLSLGSISVARSVESAFAGVAKTTNGLTDEFGKMNEAGKEVLDQFRLLAKEIPLSLEDLLKIGELAGQLGIAKEALAGFSEVVAGLAVATDLTIEEAALGLARLASIYGVTTEDMIDNTERLGSAITFLGNNFATTEPAILNFAKRLAGIAKQFGITQAEVLGFGAAITAAGVEAQLGSTAIQNALIAIGKAVETGSDELDEFARVAGMSAEEFAQAWEDDAAQAFIAFIEGLGEAGDEAFTILDEVGLSSDRTVRALIPLAAAGDLLADAIDGANQAFEDNVSLTREVTIRYATFDSHMQVLKNTVRDIGLEIGLLLLPALGGLLKIVTPIIEAIGEGLVPAFESIFNAIRESLLPAIGELLDAFGFDISTATLTESIANIGETIADGIEGLAEFLTVIADIKLAFDEGGIESVLEFLGIDPDDAQTFFAVAAGITAFATSLWLLPPVLAALKGFSLTSLFAPVIAVGTALGAISLPVLALAAALGILVGVMIQFGEDAVTNFFLLKDQVMEIFSLLGPFLEGVWDDIKTQTLAKISEIAQDITEWLNGILESFGITEEIKERWRQIWVDVKRIAVELWERIKEFLVSEWEGLVEQVETFLSPIIETISQIWEDVKTAVGEKWEEIKGAIEEKVVEIGVAIGLWVLDWVEIIKETGAKWIEAGKQMMDGILQGLQDNVKSVINFITDLAEGIIDAILSVFNMSSPSKVFADIGANLMLGLAEGIAQDADLPQIALDAAAAQIMNAGDGIANPNGAGGNTDNSHTTTVNANYSDLQTPNSIVSDLALIAMLEGAS